VKAAKQEAFEEVSYVLCLVDGLDGTLIGIGQANRFKNQFRALDDEEVEFLDAVLESERAKEAAIRKDTREQLDSFRKQQEEAEKAALAGEETTPAVEEEQLFTAGRKRKKGKEKEPLRGVKLRKPSTTSEQPSPALKAAFKPQAEKKEASAASASPVGVFKSKGPNPSGSDKGQKSPSASPPAAAAKSSILGLANYSSDEGD
jgi:hypothetical protein